MSVVAIIKKFQNQKDLIGFLEVSDISKSFAVPKYFRAIKILQSIEKKFIDVDALIEFKEITFNTIILEDINLFLKDKSKIIKYDNLEDFIFSYVEYLTIDNHVPSNIRNMLKEIKESKRIEEEALATLYYSVLHFKEDNIRG